MRVEATIVNTATDIVQNLVDSILEIRVNDQAIQSAIEAIPAGRWAVGVSGGADSVALLSLLRGRADLSLVVAHLDHQTRAGASAEDARFVQMLASEWNLPFEMARLEDVIGGVSDPPKNRSAQFCAARLAFFRRVVMEHGLAGVILAHHSDDQAETVLLRLLRGSGFAGLAGMSGRSVVGGLTILRPLLGAPRESLREHLRGIGQAWREDQSNQSPQYGEPDSPHARKSPDLSRSLVEAGKACDALRRWSNQLPEPPEQMLLSSLQDLPTILARRQAQSGSSRRRDRQCVFPGGAGSTDRHDM